MSQGSQPADTNIKPFFTKELGGKTFRFRRPTTSEIDRAMSRMGRAPTAVSTDFTGEIVLESDRAEWTAYLADKPGAATVVGQEVLEQLGF